jgi:hypothetical protein
LFLREEIRTHVVIVERPCEDMEKMAVCKTTREAQKKPTLPTL